MFFRFDVDRLYKGEFQRKKHLMSSLETDRQTDAVGWLFATSAPFNKVTLLGDFFVTYTTSAATFYLYCS
jgi:hypothetical protein